MDHKIIHLFCVFTCTYEPFVRFFAKQIVRSGTSIGANINEANYGQSKADFVSKMHIALKETAETEYWLKLLTLSEYISEDMGKSLLSDCLEIKKNPDCFHQHR